MSERNPVPEGPATFAIIMGGDVPPGALYSLPNGALVHRVHEKDARVHLPETDGLSVVVAIGHSYSQATLESLVQMLERVPSAELSIAGSQLANLPPRVLSRLDIERLREAPDGYLLVPASTTPRDNGWVISLAKALRSGNDLDEVSDSEETLERKLASVLEAIPEFVEEKNKAVLRNQELHDEVQRVRREHEALERRYKALAESRLGALTLKIWRRRKAGKR